jgi:hypothetical protein
MENENGILLTPDYAGLFRQFLKDATNNGMHLPESIRHQTGSPEEAAAVLRIVQGVIAPLNIALMSAIDRQSIEQLREVLCDITAHLNQKAGEYENESETEGNH